MAVEAGRTVPAKRAPDPLNMVQRFVNTRNQMRGYDLLGSKRRPGSGYPRRVMSRRVLSAKSNSGDFAPSEKVCELSSQLTHRVPL